MDVVQRWEIGHTAGMTPDEFNCQFAAAVADADRALITHGRVDPLYFIVDRNRRAQVVVADNTSPERKHVSMTLAQLTAIASDAELVSHQTEPWIVPCLSGCHPQPQVLEFGHAHGRSSAR
jgi:hypothetical protein